MDTVEGYMTVLDAQIIAALLSCQDEQNIAGHLCEIGVHHGRLFLMLALSRRPGERSLAIDLFEDDQINANTRHAGRNRAVFGNAQRLGIEFSDAEIFKTSSLEVSAEDVLKRTGGKVRFFSVDGSHLYREVENDLGLAARTLTDDGIIAIDDFFNTNWADVSFATGDFLRRNPTLVPFAITSKLYVASPAASAQYKAVLSKRTDLGQIAVVQILGHDVLALKPSTFQRGYEMLQGIISRRVS
jgi:hypothetical protein